MNPTLKLILRSETEFLADEHVLPVKANIFVRNSSVMYHRRDRVCVDVCVTETNGFFFN